MDAFYEEDERIVGHAADTYHRIDIRQTSRHLVVRDGDRVVADTTRPLVLYESGFAPRWYVPRADVDEAALTAAEGQTFCPYKGLASYYDVDDARRAAWSYEDAWTEVRRVSGLVSFEPDKVEVCLDGARLRLEPGQTVIPHGVDRDLTLDEAAQAPPPAADRDRRARAAVGQRRPAPERALAGQNRLHRRVEAAGVRPGHGPPAQHRRRRPGRPQGHGGEQRAVLVYQIQSYRHWQQHFGRDDFDYGQFGENLTVDGLPDDEVCIGDRYRIGEAEFEVTQPRVTCYRVGPAPRRARTARAAGQPPSPRLLHACRPRRTDPGRRPDHQDPDRARRVDRGRHRRAALPPRPRPGQAAPAIQIPALSPGWQESFRDLLEAAESQRPHAARHRRHRRSSALARRARVAGVGRCR